MAYELDLRKRVVAFVNSGGSKTTASKLFSVSRWCVYDWCRRHELASTPPPGRPRSKLNWDQLKEDVRNHPDRLLKEHAERHGVRVSTIWHACQKMGISNKKKR